MTRNQEIFPDVHQYMRTFTYMRLSTLTLRSSGNCWRHFSRNVEIVSPFLHYVARIGVRSV